MTLIDRFKRAEADRATNHDAINPSHYTSDPSGIECIEITRHRNFNIGAVFKYLWRAGLKDIAPEVEDLKKAAWYLADEIGRLEGTGNHAGQPDHQSEYRVWPGHNAREVLEKSVAINELVRCDECLCQFRPKISKKCLNCGCGHGLYVEPPALANALYAAPRAQ